ncbi:MAG TPA: hypothetical protein DHV96_04850 [Lachnospiraceae bacterium]|nr:hypothetical protein [Lachnospiraceae bacterium]
MRRFWRRVMVAAMTVTMVVSSVGVAKKEVVAASSYTLKDKTVQELMKEYGVIAFDKANLNAHFHGNFLVNKVKMNSNCGLKSEYNTYEAFYFASAESLNASISEVGSDILYTSAVCKTENNENRIVLDDGAYFKIDRPRTVISDADQSVKYVDLNDVKSKFIIYNQEITSHSSDGNVTLNFSDQNSRQIRVNSGEVNYINISYDDLHADTNTYIEFSDLNNNDILVINVDMKGQTDAKLHGMILGAKDSEIANSESNFTKKYNRIFYNIYDSSKSDKQYEGTLTFSERGFGTVIAPSANIIMASNWDGTIIANQFTNGAQYHRVDGTEFPKASTEPSTPSGGESGSTEPSTPSGGESGSTEPSTPSGSESGSTQPGTPSGGESGSTEPGTPSGGESGDTKPSTPSDGESGSTQPGTPSGGESGTTTEPGTSGGGESSVTQPDTPGTDNPSKGDLTIIITDEKTDEPVPGATIEVTTPTGDKTEHVTDSTGTVTIKDTPAGDYSVVVTDAPKGYTVTKNKKVTVTVEKGQTTEKRVSKNATDAKNARKALRHAADVKTGLEEKVSLKKQSVTKVAAKNAKTITKNYNKNLKNYKKKHKKQAKEVAAWITINGTRINYPVMYTGIKNNTKYLHKNIDGKEDSHGMLFASYITPKRRISYNNIIYGHNMKDGSMFAGLNGYASKSFFKKHKYVKLDTAGYNYVYEVVDIFRISCAKGSKDRMIYEKFAQLDNKKVYKKWKKQVAKNREYNCGGKYNSSDELLILSTCEYSKENGRLAILCKQVKCKKNK